MYWIIVGIVVAAGIGASIYLNDEQPEMIPKTHYSSFEGPAQLSEAIHDSLQPELKASPIVMLGVMPGQRAHLEVWKAFLETEREGVLGYNVIVTDPDLPFVDELFPKAIKIDLKKERERFVDGAKNALSSNLRLAYIGPTIYVSQALKESPVNLIPESANLQMVSLSLVGFPRTAEQESKADIPCVMGPHDRDGAGALGCMTVNQARRYYRQPSEPGAFEGVINQAGKRDYLILFNSPVQ